MSKNRRKYFRINPSSEQCVIKHGGVELDGQIINESIDGLRIEIPAVDELQMGASFEVQYDGKTTVANPKNLSRTEPGRFEVGLQREDVPSNEAPEQRLLQYFVCLSNQSIACRVVNQNAGRTTVALADGKEFLVDNSKVQKRTVCERRSELLTDDTLQQVLLLYSLIDSAEQLDDVESVLEYEFRIG